MKLCVISDIHGNVEALQAVLARIRLQGADMVVVAGDLVAQGPRPAETLDELRQLRGGMMIRGNTERYVTDPTVLPWWASTASDAPQRLRSLEWTREKLGDERLRFLAALPGELQLDDCLIVHGSPGNDERGVFPTTPLESFDTPAWTAVLACGHTHEPVCRRFDRRHLINAGSVGWPLDGDRRPSFAVLEHRGADHEWSTRIERVEYDRSRVVRDLDARATPWGHRVRQLIETARPPSKDGSMVSGGKAALEA